jgi:protein-disulfide isomerase
MQRFLSALGLALTLVLGACVDTTGLSAATSRTATGNPQSAVVVTEYGDLQCPACRAAYLTINKPLLEKYGTQIRFEFKHFPLRSIHRYALDLAEAAECAADQGKFWEFVDYDYEHQEDLDGNSAKAWAKAVGVTDDPFNRCVSSHIKRDEILKDYDAGTALGVSGTPTYYVNGTQVTSTLPALSAAVDGALKTAVQKL